MRRSIALSLVLLTALGGWLAVKAYSAQRELTAARSDLTAAARSLESQDLDGASRGVSAAGGHTEVAVAATSGRLWRITARLPVLGRPLQAVSDIAGVSHDLATAVLPPAVAAAEAVDVPTLRSADGLIDVRRLQSAQEPVRTAADRGVAAATRAQSIPVTGLSPIDTARASLRAEAARLSAALTSADRALSLAPTLLGADRPRRYLVLVQQTAESRGTGGLPGGFAVITAAKGRLTVTDQGPNTDLREFAVPPPAGVPADYVARYADLGAFDTVANVNLSPDLPVVARVVAARWLAQSGERIDGVIAVDAVGLSDLLRGSGPLRLGDRMVAPDDLPDYLAVGQYRDFAPRSSTEGIDRSRERKDALEEAGAAAARRLASGGGEPKALVRGLVAAITGGHVRMASDDPALAPGLVAGAIDGALPRGPSPVAYPVVFNSSGGKLDTFLDRTVSYSSLACANGRRATRIVVRLVSQPPASGLPPYVTTAIVNGKLGQSRVNRVTLAVYGTRGSVLGRATLDGQPLAEDALVPGTEAGLSVWSTLLDLPPGKARVLTLDLDEPWVGGAPRVPEQPLARPLATEVRWPDCR